MIKLTINSSNLSNKLNELSGSIKELVSPTVLQEVAKAAFVITGHRFVLDADRYAVQNPKKMHHVYEWNELGNPNGRLFVIERLGILNGNLTISYSFLPSRLPVPIPPEMTNPGPNGRSVQKQNVFKDKAQVMEDGKPITYTTSRVLAFLGQNGPTFIRPGTLVNILNPGGIESKNAFADYMVQWYTDNANLVIQNSGFYDQIVNESAAAISNGAGISGVRQIAAALANKVGGSTVEIR
jgi:hypothetical protein